MITTAVRSAAICLALLAGLTACGGGTPSKADFTAKVRAGIGDDLGLSLNVQGISEDVLADAIDAFVDCEYESIKDQPTLLKTVYDDPTASTVSGTLETLTAACSAELTRTLTESASPVPTTIPPELATTIPPELATTTVPG